MLKIYIGADHRGFHLKEEIVKWLRGKGFEIEDMGAHEFNENDDYSDYAHKIAEEVNLGRGYGILICGSGQGMSMAANKHKSVRASLCWDAKSAKAAKNDSDANILVLPADFINTSEAIEITKTWLEAPFLSEEKYMRRIDKIEI